MAFGFQSNAFQNSAFQTRGGSTPTVTVNPSAGSGGRRKYGDGVSYEQWQELSALRERLADMALAKRAPAKTVQAVRKAAAPLVERMEVPADVWTPPDSGAIAADVALGITRLLDYMAQIDALDAAAREAWAQRMRDDDEAAAMLLLH